MTRLDRELQRLFRHPNAPETDPPSRIRAVGPDGDVRTLVIRFAKGADWPKAAQLCEGIEHDLGLPAPAVSVGARGGYQVWLSLAEPVAAHTARAFVTGLTERLVQAPPSGFDWLPGCESEAPSCIDAPPMQDAETGRWSAFIDPALGAIFSDEAGLDLAPSPDKQAELLGRCQPMAASEFQRVLALLVPPESAAAPDAHSPMTPRGLNRHFDHPRSFLLAVMNDPDTPLRERIEAAKALLAHMPPSA